MAKGVGSGVRAGRGRAPLPQSGPDAVSREMFSGDREIYHGYDVETRAASRSIFGRNVSDDELADLAGAPAGHSVNINANASGGYIEIEVSGDLINSWRMIRRTNRGPVVSNELLALQEGAPRSAGIGVRVFAKQVETARRMGVRTLTTTAGGSSDSSRNDAGYNGYYTWARTGYNATLDGNTRSRIKRDLGTEPYDMNELMSTRAGRQWWKSNGDEWDGTFDTRPSSSSSRTLQSYLDERGIRVS